MFAGWFNQGVKEVWFKTINLFFRKLIHEDLQKSLILVPVVPIVLALVLFIWCDWKVYNVNFSSKTQVLLFSSYITVSTPRKHTIGNNTILSNLKNLTLLIIVDKQNFKTFFQNSFREPNVLGKYIVFFICLWMPTTLSHIQLLLYLDLYGLYNKPEFDMVQH